ncbi:dTDP-4-dehydrorhamnose reductase [Crenobacter luteus]|nr:dTDP-4-dehydrorhamnose reductase [Crenobacter luteus]
MVASRYIVIGGHGYLGAKLYASIPDGIIGLRTASSPSEGFLRLRLEVRQDGADLPINDGDVVFLTAAISAPDICVREHDRAWAVNVTGTTELIENVIARGGRVIFFSSDTIYGEHVDEFEERASCNPAGEYAVMKYEVEQRFAGNPSFKAIRLSYVYSREDKFSRYLAGCAERNEEADLFHPFFRAIVHRDDVVTGALKLAERWDEMPEQVINFGGPKVISRIDFAECLREAYLHDLRFKVTEPGPDFFKNRPRVISMISPVFARLLGRPPRTLCEAARLESASFSNSERVL